MHRTNPIDAVQAHKLPRGGAATGVVGLVVSPSKALGRRMAEVSQAAILILYDLASCAKQGCRNGINEAEEGALVAAREGAINGLHPAGGEFSDVSSLDGLVKIRVTGSLSSGGLAMEADAGTAPERSFIRQSAAGRLGPEARDS